MKVSDGQQIAKGIERKCHRIAGLEVVSACSTAGNDLVLVSKLEAELAYFKNPFVQHENHHGWIDQFYMGDRELQTPSTRNHGLVLNCQFLQLLGSIVYS